MNEISYENLDENSVFMNNYIEKSKQLEHEKAAFWFFLESNEYKLFKDRFDKQIKSNKEKVFKNLEENKDIKYTFKDICFKYHEISTNCLYMVENLIEIWWRRLVNYIEEDIQYYKQQILTLNPEYNIKKFNWNDLLLVDIIYLQKFDEIQQLINNKIDWEIIHETTIDDYNPNFSIEDSVEFDIKEANYMDISNFIDIDSIK